MSSHFLKFYNIYLCTTQKKVLLVSWKMARNTEKYWKEKTASLGFSLKSQTVITTSKMVPVETSHFTALAETFRGLKNQQYVLLISSTHKSFRCFSFVCLFVLPPAGLLQSILNYNILSNFFNKVKPHSII